MEKRLKYEFLYERIKVETYYELSFEVEIEKHEEIRLAYCIPYSYNQLLQDLQLIKGHAEVAILGKTLTGINIPVVMIGRGELAAKKRVVMVTGRVHPSETNSSLLISTILKDLCFSPEL
jgi:hypothetical protein